MKPIHIAILAMLVAIASAAYVAWQQDQGPAEEFGERIDEGVEEVRDEVDDAR